MLLRIKYAFHGAIDLLSAKANRNFLWGFVISKRQVILADFAGFEKYGVQYCFSYLTQ